MRYDFSSQLDAHFSSEFSNKYSKCGPKYINVPSELPEGCTRSLDGNWARNCCLPAARANSCSRTQTPHTRRNASNPLTLESRYQRVIIAIDFYRRTITPRNLLQSAPSFSCFRDLHPCPFCCPWKSSVLAVQPVRDLHARCFSYWITSKGQFLTLYADYLILKKYSNTSCRLIYTWPM